MAKDIVSNDDFDDAIIEIADEIAQIKRLNRETKECSTECRSSISAKPGEKKKTVEIPSKEFLRTLKSLREIKVYNNQSSSLSHCSPLSKEQTYTPPSNDDEQITTSLITPDNSIIHGEITDRGILTFDDLFEKPKIEDIPLVKTVSDIGINTKLDTSHNISHSKSQLADITTNMNNIKRFNIPETLSKKILNSLKNDERKTLLKFLKVHK